MAIPESIDQVNIDDPEELAQFFRRISRRGGEEVRRDRLAAVAAGIIDLKGNLLREPEPVDERLTVEQ
jgi:hypothetical protein